MENLTEKQGKVLSFIEAYRKKHGTAPSFQEIQGHFAFASPNAATKHVRALERKGALSLRPRTARSIVPLRPAPGEVPLLGRIAAGAPIEAIENVETKIDLSALGIDNEAGGYFALTVRGDSMIEAAILDGDLVVVKKQPEVAPGEVAAVRWNGEATLKYVRRKGDRMLLVPANGAMRPIVVDKEKTESFEVLGKVVRVIRKI